EARGDAGGAGGGGGVSPSFPRRDLRRHRTRAPRPAVSLRPARRRLAAAAVAATVLIVRPAEPANDVTTEAAVRLRGELVAGGFDVDVVDAPAGDPRVALDEAAAGSTAVAVVAIVAGA